MMLEVVLDKHILVILIGIAAVLGVLSKCVAGFSLKRLVRAAGNMNKSSHALVRLIKAKFEHTCMISDKVQNVDAFVGKYIYEYRVLGLRLHTWRRLEKAGVWLCLIFGLAGGAAWYSLHGMGDQVLKYAAGGAGTAIIIFLFQLTGDEKYQLDAVKNYMVDYLENICARKYEKAQQKEIREEWREMAPPEQEKVPAAQAAKVVQAAQATQAVPQMEPEELEIADPADELWEAANSTKPELTRAESARLEPARPEIVGNEPARTERAEPVKAEKSQVFAQRSKSTAKAAAAKKKAEAVQEIKEDKEKQQDVPKEVLIREILEEFLA